MTTLKRAFDITVSIIGLVALAPLFALIAAAIRLEDGGPALFRQTRIGRHGTTFSVLKFRKFSHRASGAGSMVTLTDDDRYSRVGRFLEKTKLNELPQLINVLQGHMSIVGPRPEIPDFLHCYIGPYERLYEFQPGIFGPSQSAFRDEASFYPPDQDPMQFYERVLFPQKAIIDISYYPAATLRSDIVWIARSLGAVIGLHRSDRPRAAHPVDTQSAAPAATSGARNQG